MAHPVPPGTLSCYYGIRVVAGPGPVLWCDTEAAVECDTLVLDKHWPPSF